MAGRVAPDGAANFLGRIEGCPGCGVGYSGTIGVEVVLLTGRLQFYYYWVEKFLRYP
jgi:hypothetical protein